MELFIPHGAVLFDEGVNAPVSSAESLTLLYEAASSSFTSVVKGLSTSAEVTAFKKTLKDLGCRMVEKNGEMLLFPFERKTFYEKNEFPLIDFGGSLELLSYLIPNFCLFGGARFLGVTPYLWASVNPLVSELEKNNIAFRLNDGILTVHGFLRGGTYGGLKLFEAKGLLTALCRCDAPSILSLSSGENARALEFLAEKGIKAQLKGTVISVFGGQTPSSPSVISPSSDTAFAAAMLSSSLCGGRPLCGALSLDKIKRTASVLQLYGCTVTCSCDKVLAKRNSSPLTGYPVDISGDAELIYPVCLAASFLKVPVSFFCGRMGERVLSVISSLGGKADLSGDILSVSAPIKGGSIDVGDDPLLALALLFLAPYCECGLTIRGNGLSQMLARYPLIKDRLAAQNKNGVTLS